MTEWKEYNARDDEHAEMANADAWICRYEDNTESRILSKKDVGVSGYIDANGSLFAITHYLICEPRPFAEMIIRQAQTGQMVYVREKGIYSEGSWIEYYPFWDLEKYEYSFTPFED